MQSSPAAGVADEIAGWIQDGRFAPGVRLPSERELARRLGVSRPMIREGLRRLVGRGLVEVQPGRGTFVSTAASLAAPGRMERHYRRRGATARQLSEARIMLECQTARLAAARATDDALAELRRSLEALEASPTPLDFVRNDLAFHMAIARAAGNPVIESMLTSIAGLSVELMVRSVGDQRVQPRSAPYHRTAYEAIIRRDPDAAEEAMRVHLTFASEAYGDDYDRPLDSMATRALRLLGAYQDLASFLRSVVPPDAEDH